MLSKKKGISGRNRLFRHSPAVPQHEARIRQGLPVKSMRGREKVSLSSVRVIAPAMPREG